MADYQAYVDWVNSYVDFDSIDNFDDFVDAINQIRNIQDSTGSTDRQSAVFEEVFGFGFNATPTEASVKKVNNAGYIDVSAVQSFIGVADQRP